MSGTVDASSIGSARGNASQSERIKSHYQRRWHRERTARKTAKKMGDDLLSHRVSPAVPSALAGLTSLFGMGRGVSPPPSSPFLKSGKYSVVRPARRRWPLKTA